MKKVEISAEINGVLLIIEHLVYRLADTGLLDRAGLAQVISDDAQRMLQFHGATLEHEHRVLKLFADRLKQEAPKVGDLGFQIVPRPE